MYYFNSLLFENLSKVLGITQNEISTRCFGNNYIYARRLKNQDLLSVKELTEVCNALHISIARFISLDPQDTFVTNRFKYVIPENEFKPIRSHTENIRWVYGKKGLGKNISREKFAEQIGVSLSRITRWINPEIGGVTVKHIIMICNLYRIDMEVFIEDHNMPIDKITEEPEVSEDNPRIWKEISDLKAALEEYRKESLRLSDENRRLRTEITAQTTLSEEERSGYGRMVQREWTVNWPLIENLYNILGITRKELIEAAGMKNYNMTFFDGNLPVISLVKICNTYRISTRHFFIYDCPEYPQLKDYGYYRSQNWKKVVFHPEYLNDLYGKDSITGISRLQLEKICDLTEWKVRSWRKEKSTMRLKDLVLLCNRLEITPSCFISDRNTTGMEYALTPTEILLEENRMLRQHIIRLEEKIKYGKGKIPSDDE